MRADPEGYGKRVVKFMLYGGLGVSISQRMAHDILGANFFGIGEWLMFYGLGLSEKQFREVAEFPWSKEVLESPDPWEKGKLIKETHFGFLGVESIRGKPLNLPQWVTIRSAEERHPRFPRFDLWYIDHKFAQKTCELRWYLMPIRIPDSTNKTYCEQLEMLSESYEVPLTVERVTANILYCQLNGVYLDRSFTARCRDKDDLALRVLVQGWSNHGLKLSQWADSESGNIGLAASRKILS